VYLVGRNQTLITPTHAGCQLQALAPADKVMEDVNASWVLRRSVVAGKSKPNISLWAFSLWSLEGWGYKYPCSSRYSILAWHKHGLARWTVGLDRPSLCLQVRLCLGQPPPLPSWALQSPCSRSAISRRLSFLSSSKVAAGARAQGCCGSKRAGLLGRQTCFSSQHNTNFNP
jgi:hypothetical protein